MELNSIQKALQSESLDGWLLTDFQKTNSHAREFLKLDADAPSSRRWFYFIPAQGTPHKLVHAVESGALDNLPGEKTVYLSRNQLISQLHHLLENFKTIAMEYSPENRIPTISRVDAGTIELIRSAGPAIVSSGNLLQLLTARWGECGLTSHHAAADALRKTVDRVWQTISDHLGKDTLTEFDVVQFIMDSIHSENLIADHDAICAVDDHAADPHYSVTAEAARIIQPDQLVLIDLWARQPGPGSIYADMTWMAFTGSNPSPQILTVFDTVKTARDTAVSFVEDAFHQGRTITGADVDRACRSVIEQAGFGQYYIHRTGHSLAGSVHGPGANIDSLESDDTRVLIPDTGFTIEPGIYLPGRFGVRLELDMAVLPDGRTMVTGQPIQTDLVLIH
jgi:Xaa-Pro aminopeptidase